MEAARKVLNELFEKEDSINSCVEIIKLFVEKHPGICEQPDEDGYLPLHSAINERCPFPVLELLVSFYPEARSIKLQGEWSFKHWEVNALHIICYHAESFDLETFRLLTTPEAARIEDKNGQLPLHAYCNCGEEEYDLNVEVIRMLVDAYPDGAYQQDREGMTPLHNALHVGADANVPAIELLIRMCPQAASKVAKIFRELPLHTVCIDCPHDGAGIIQLLVEAYPQAADLFDINVRSPLHHLCCSGVTASESFPGTIRLLLNTAPESAMAFDTDNDTPLDCLCRQGDERDMAAIESFIDACPKALMVRDSMNRTLLHRLLSDDRYLPHEEVIRLLVSKSTALLESNDTGECGTPLHYLCQNGALDTNRKVQFLKLLAISERAVRTRDRCGQTPLHVLCGKGASQGQLRTLLDVFPDLAMVKDGGGQVPLHVAVRSEEKPKSCTFDKTVQCLLEAHAGAVCAKDIAGTTPLQLACERDVSLNKVYQLVRMDPVANLGLRQGRHNAFASRKRKRPCT